MAERSVCAVVSAPSVWSPRVLVEVANATVIGGEPVFARENSGEGVVHISENSNVGVEEDESGVSGKLEHAEFRPGVREACCD